MKLLIRNGKIAAITTDAYEGPDIFVTAPRNFDISRASKYTLLAGVLAISRKTLALEIDEAVGAIYDRYTRFQPEYEAREAEALAYRALDYAGPIPKQVAAFSTPTGRTGRQAADIIIAQSNKLRGALAMLGVLRMRKYEITLAADDASAEKAFFTILASVKSIGANIT